MTYNNIPYNISGKGLSPPLYVAYTCNTNDNTSTRIQLVFDVLLCIVILCIRI